MDLGFSNTVALVTGGSRGIGREIALTLAREGCHVAICARDDATLSTTLHELQLIDPSARALKADVTCDDDVKRVVADVVQAFGRITFLVACAGGTIGSESLGPGASTEWLNTYDLNAVHPIRFIREALPHLKAQSQASILLISSISGAAPVKFRAQYAASKAAVIHIASSLARELAPHGIRVNALCPGSILVPGGKWDQLRITDPERYSRFVNEELPLGRLGTVREVAEVATFLLSERASWINGTKISVDGGQRDPSAW